MAQIAYIFPGQGAQYVGMGKDLYESYPSAREVFDRAGETIKFDLKKLCFEGPAEELTKTSNSQAAILVHSLAALAAIEKQSYDPKFALGLSLGEYTALASAGALSLEDAVRLVRKRGQLMEAASKKTPGKMASIIGMDVSELGKLCKGFGCEIANLNCPGQAVISGSSSSVELTAGMAKEKGAKRVIMLDVSGAFHSSAMDPAKEKLEEEISRTVFNAPKFPVVCNVTGEPTTDPEEIKKNLVIQVNSTTYWEKSVRYVMSRGITNYFEIGPGSVLKGLLRKIDKSLNVTNIDKAADLTALIAAEAAQ